MSYRKIATPDDAADATLAIVGSEFGGAAYLSADHVATDDDGMPILSVIHLDDRRHWNLTVRTALPKAEDISQTAGAGQLLDVLDKARDGEFVLVIGDRGWWTLTVEVLEPAVI